MGRPVASILRPAATATPPESGRGPARRHRPVSRRGPCRAAPTSWRWSASARRGPPSRSGPGPPARRCVSERALRSARTVTGSVTRRTAAGSSPLRAGPAARSVRAPSARFARRAASPSTLRRRARRDRGPAAPRRRRRCRRPPAAQRLEGRPQRRRRSSTARPRWLRDDPLRGQRQQEADLGRDRFRAGGDVPTLLIDVEHAPVEERDAAGGGGGRARSVRDHDVGHEGPQGVLPRAAGAAQRVGSAG